MKDVLVKKDPKSAEIIRPILRGRDIKRYGFDWANLWLLNVHNGLVDKGISPIDINNYPIIKAFLDNYYPKLLVRQDKGITPYNLRSCAYMEDFDRHKIISAELARTGNSFAFDDNGFYCLAGAFILTFGDNDNGKFSYKYLVSLLNHPTTLLYLEYVYSKLDSTGWQWKKEPIEKIPIPRIDITKQNQFESLYDEYINALEKEKIEALVEIDKSIFDLYCFNSKERSFTFSKLKVFTYEAPFFT